MEPEIHRINHISLNKSKTEFCLSYNNGLKTYNLEKFIQNNSSNNFEVKLGGISFSEYLPKDDIIIFVGTKLNKIYSNKKVVFFDIVNKKEILSKSFDEEITYIKFVDNYLLISLGKELKIFLYENNELISKYDISISGEKSKLFEAWVTKEENNVGQIIHKSSTLYIAYVQKNEISIKVLTCEDEFKVNKIQDINTPVTEIQNLFYIKKLNQIFICDEKAIYIYGFDVDTGEVKLCLRRGSNPGLITSMTLLNNNFLAINNKNKTIHIFDLDINNNAFSFSNIVYSMVYGIQEIYPCLRIYYKDLVKENEGQFFNIDFKEKGAVLVSEDEGNEFKIIAYNGYAYKIQVDFKNSKYEVLLKVCYSDDKNDTLKETLKSASVLSSNIFNKKK
jgi:hypothetical protein